MDTRCDISGTWCCITTLPHDCWKSIVRKISYEDLQSLWMTGCRKIHYILGPGAVLDWLYVTFNEPLDARAYYYRWSIPTHRFHGVRRMTLAQKDCRITPDMYWIPSLNVPLRQYMPITLTHLCLRDMQTPLDTILLAPPLLRTLAAETSYLQLLTRSRLFLEMSSLHPDYYHTATEIVGQFLNYVRAHSPWADALPNLEHFDYTNYTERTLIYSRNSVDVQIRPTRQGIGIDVLALLPSRLRHLYIPTTPIVVYDISNIPSFSELFPHVSTTPMHIFRSASISDIHMHLSIMWKNYMYFDPAMRNAIQMHAMPNLNRHYEQGDSVNAIVRFTQNVSDTMILRNLPVHVDDHQFLNNVDVALEPAIDTVIRTHMPLLSRFCESNDISQSHKNLITMVPFSVGIIQFSTPEFRTMINDMLFAAGMGFLVVAPLYEYPKHHYDTLMSQVISCIMTYEPILTYMEQFDQAALLSDNYAQPVVEACLKGIFIMLSNDISKRTHLISLFKTLAKTFKTTHRHLLRCAKCNEPLFRDQHADDANNDLDALCRTHEVGLLDENGFYYSNLVTNDLTAATMYLNRELDAIRIEQEYNTRPNIFTYRSVRVRRSLYLAMDIYGLVRHEFLLPARTNPLYHNKFQLWLDEFISTVQTGLDEYVCSQPQSAHAMNRTECLRAIQVSLQQKFKQILGGPLVSVPAAFNDIHWHYVYCIAVRYYIAQTYDGDPTQESSHCHVHCDRILNTRLNNPIRSDRWNDISFAIIRAIYDNTVLQRETVSNANVVNPITVVGYVQQSTKTLADDTRGVARRFFTPMPMLIMADEFIIFTPFRQCDGDDFHELYGVPPASTASFCSLERHDLYDPRDVVNELACTMSSYSYLTYISITTTNAERPETTIVIPLVECINIMPKTLTRLGIVSKLSISDEPTSFPPNLVQLILVNSQSLSMEINVSQEFFTPQQLATLPSTLTTFRTNLLRLCDLCTIPPSVIDFIPYQLQIHTEDDFAQLQYLPCRLQRCMLQTNISLALYHQNMAWPTTLTHLIMDVESNQGHDDADPGRMNMTRRNTHDAGCTQKWPSHLRTLHLHGYLPENVPLTIADEWICEVPLTLQVLIIDINYAFLSPRACQTLGRRIPTLREFRAIINLMAYDDDVSIDDGFIIRITQDDIDNAQRFYYMELNKYNASSLTFAHDLRYDAYHRAHLRLRAHIQNILTSLPRELRIMDTTITYGKHDLQCVLPILHLEHYESLPAQLTHFVSANTVHPSVTQVTLRTRRPDVKFHHVSLPQ